MENEENPAVKFFADKADEWNPSTEIADAWEVVDKVRDDNFEIAEHGTHWKARFGVHWAGGLTAPEAICKATLRTVERD